MAVSDFLKDKGDRKGKKVHAQLSMQQEFFSKVRAALDEDGLTFQEVLTAGLESWLIERKKGKKNEKSQS